MDGAMNGGLDLPSALHSAALGGKSPDAANGPDTEQPRGPFLDLDIAQVFKAVHQLVMRQEQLAKNRLAIDTYYTHVKRGHGLFYRLEKEPDRNTYKCVIAPGTSALTQAAVPNKLADLCHKVVETLMVDPPAPSPRAETDSEEAERAAEMAEEFLTQDGGEAGTRDHRLFWAALDSATSKSASFLHYWVDQTGNGCVPLQIKAHPMAQDPANPLVGPDGAPTTDLVLRYVTAPEGGQFTEDPSQAAPQWLPKIRVDRLGREHVRTFPETADVADAEMVVLLHHCTLGEAKRRWPDTVGTMPDPDLGKLCDWTPPRFLPLLPPALRARWKLQTGDGADPKGSSNDERTMFYYAVYRRATPDYPKGCAVFVSGADEGTELSRDTLSAEIPAPDGKGTAVRCLDIPLVQVELLADADDRDPMGIPLAARVSGPNEAAQLLATGYLEALDKALHPAVFIPTTSPVTEDDIQESRATGRPVVVLSKDDFPQYEEAPPLPGVENMIGFQYEQMDSMMSTSKPAQGADSQQEVSGVARQIAVQQSNVALSRMQQAVQSAFERHWRIKCQLAMAKFTVPQMIRYEGEDGAYKQEWWSGVDFAHITDVAMKPGSGTMMPPQQKVSYVQQMTQASFMTPEQALSIARPTFADTLGLPPDPQQQRVERQVGTWLKGVPSPQWLQQAQAFEQAKQVADQQNAQATQAYQQHVQQITQAHQQSANDQQAQDKLAPGVSSAPAAPVLPPPPQPVPPMDPTTGQPMSPPWTPFDVLPMDDEPLIAELRQARLRDVMATAKFKAQPPEWQNVLIESYKQARTAVAASQAPPALPKGVNVAVKADPSNVGQAEQAATHPGQQQAA